MLDLKTLQDWVLQRRFRAVPGVIDVTGWGGKTKTYELQVDFNKLVANGLTLPQLLQAVGNSNINVGGNTVNIGTQSAVVRGVGLIRSIDDLANTMVSQSGGNPVLVKDVATVTVGEKPRLGIAGLDHDDDIVQGIVLMRRGEQSSPTILRVEQLVASINNSSILPPGVRIERIYDRKDLIDITTATVLHNMVVGILLIVLLQWIFLGDLRSALIVGATIPFALFFAVIILVLRGESANLLSVGAIDFGLIVDATVIMVEAIFRRLSQTTALSEAEQSHISTDTTMGMKSHAILSAAADVSRSIFFAAAIIIAAFLPLFTLSGVEGNIFGPMARTYAYALAGGLLATFTITPALSAIILPRACAGDRDLDHGVPAPALCAGAELGGRQPQAGDGRRHRARGHDHVLGRAARPRIPAQARGRQSVDSRHAAADHLAGRGQRLRQRDAQADPQPPRSGSRWCRSMAVPTTAPTPPACSTPNSLRRSSRSANGRVPMTRKNSPRELLAQLQDKFPGVEFNFSQYLQDNVSEAVSGVKGENSIKLYGNDLQALTETANKIKSVLATVQGITDLAVFTSLGQPTIQIDIDRAKAARYGLAPGDINATIKVAIGGDSAGDLYEPGSDRHFPIIVRLAPEYRKSAEAIQNLRIGAPGPERHHHAGAAERSRLDQAGVRRGLYLSRAAGALSADQVLGARTRPRRRDPGSAGQGRRAGQAAAGIADRMGRRVRQSAGRHPAAVDRGADQPDADRGAAVVQFRLDGRHAAGDERDPDGDLRRRARASDQRHSLQRVGGDRVHRAVRHRRDGRHHHPVAVQSTDRRGLRSHAGPWSAPANCSFARC